LFDGVIQKIKGDVLGHIVYFNLVPFIFEIFDVEEYCDLEIEIRGQSPANLYTICKPTSLKSTDPRALFLPLILWTCLQSDVQKKAI